jgi:hypothetical protein
VRKRVTIVQDNEHQNVLNYCSGASQFIINKSQALLDIGYSVSHGFARNLYRINQVDDYPGKWDSTAGVLTLGMQNIPNELLRFEFSSQGEQSDSEFSVFIRGGSPTVRRGSSFSSSEEWDICRSLGDAPRENGEQCTILNSSNGTESSIVVRIRETEVSFSRIFNVDVDVIST